MNWNVITNTVYTQMAHYGTALGVLIFEKIQINQSLVDFQCMIEKHHSCMCATRSGSQQNQCPTPGTLGVRWEYILDRTQQDTKNHLHLGMFLGGNFENLENSLEENMWNYIQTFTYVNGSNQGPWRQQDHQHYTLHHHDSHLQSQKSQM